MPMTDKEKMQALFEELGIPFKVKTSDKINHCHQEADEVIKIRVDYKEGAQVVDGYGRFYTQFEFSVTGQFLKVGVWE